MAGEAGATPSVTAGGAVESSTYVIEPAEQADALPAESVAVARSVVVESSATATDSPGVAKSAAGPAASAAPPHAPPAYRRTVEPAAAVPLTVGALALVGEAGATAPNDGAPGAIESSTYVIAAGEHADVFAAASVAVARSVVVESSATATASPGDANAAADPLATIAPPHEPPAYSRTVAPVSAAPLAAGALALAGESGSKSLGAGGAGAVESSTYVVAPAGHGDVLPAASSATARSSVEVSSGTVIANPGDANSAAGPMARSVVHANAAVEAHGRSNLGDALDDGRVGVRRRGRNDGAERDERRRRGVDAPRAARRGGIGAAQVRGAHRPRVRAVGQTRERPR